MNENPNVISSNKGIYFSIELRIFENQLAIDPKIMFIPYLLYYSRCGITISTSLKKAGLLERRVYWGGGIIFSMP